MTHVEHLGIAVADLEGSIPLFEALLGTAVYKIETVESEQVRTAFLQCGPNKIELLEATGPESPIAKSLEKRGAGIHHVAFAVHDIEAEMNRLKSMGFSLLNEQPKKGADGKLVAFVHPKSAGGVLLELCMDDPEATPAV
ncbi:methylmalonyl-CoA epimerase [bacterium]|nr:methylmalonyl-CoA epimerase [bacterium]